MTQHLPRTAHVDILVTKTLEIDEPDWCIGHPNSRAEFKADVTHFGPEQLLEFSGVEVLRAVLAQSPYSERSSTATALYVETGDFTGSYNPDEIEQLADALTAAAARLRTLGQGLAAILAGGDQ